MKITLDVGIELTIPDQYEYSTCRGCGVEDIVWATTKAGKHMPIHYLPEKKVWTSHFSDCPKANKFRSK